MNTILSLVLLFVLSVYGAEGLSCYCNAARCEDTELLKQRCKGGLVDNVCHCCKTCAKIEGETCGGLWGLDGICDEDLFCKGSDPLYMTRGVCVSKQPKPELPTRWQKVLKTTENSYSGDGSGDDSAREGSGELPEKVPTWKYEPTEETTEPTGYPEFTTFDPSEDQENENMVIF